MHSYMLNLPGKFGVRVMHESEPVFKYGRSWMLAGAYLPGVSFGSEQKIGYSISVRADQNPILLHAPASNRHPILFDTWKGDSSLLDILNLSYGCARLLWLRQKMFPVHAACIGDDSGYVLLVGPSGIGKSAIVHNAMTKLGKKIFSGNKTLVEISPEGYLRAMAGTKTMTAGKADDKPMLWSLKTDYLGRVATVHDDNHYAPTPTVDIKAIVMPRLNDGAASNEKLSPVSALHRLYPFFLDRVNADVVLSERGVFVGNAPKNTEAHLAHELINATSCIPIHAVSGSMDFVTDAISRI